MTKVPGIWLLASAFAPLVALLAVLNLAELGRAGWAVLALCVLAELLLYLSLRSLSRVQPDPIATTSVKRADERVLAFTSSYIVPIVIALFGGSDTTKVVGTVALVVLLALIYVRAGLYHLNPTLAVFGFRLYEVTAANGAVTMLLSRADHIPQRSQLKCHFLGPDVAIQLKGPP
ncbi:hypothetical protein [Georgenia faecalis]|uniref:hypothetical protein n=1 Tax=Georgenia faecalis TaxID=2483799 RepID=UPI000FDBCB25|nr:hypothetical protein [Georgenia faecalis]